jgi:uncharacterized membrane protein YeaQ/YmgE (transglycosylase-associated protein family)
LGRTFRANVPKAPPKLSRSARRFLFFGVFIITTYILCAIGLGLGWLAGQMAGNVGKVLLVENLAVGLFGSFLGGDWLVSTLQNSKVSDAAFHISTLAWAVGGTALMLLCLRLLRGAMGEMKISKGKPNR